MGVAQVLAVEPCPPIRAGPGCLVTGRFVHEVAGPVVRLSIDGQAEPTRVTPNHPYWSATRQAFIPAGELQPGERVDTLAGPRQVAGLDFTSRPTTVYNIEVHRHHAYRVGDLGVLVHNGCEGRLRDPKTGRWISDPANPPSPYKMTDAQRRAHWKQLANDPKSPLTPAQRAQIKKRGWRGPQQTNEYGELETMELSHEPIPLREGGKNVVPR